VPLQPLVTLLGQNFSAGSTVLFDGNPAATSYISSSSVQFQIAASTWNVAQTHTVQVSDSSNDLSNIATLEVYAPQSGPQPFSGQLTQYITESLIGNDSLVPDLNGDGRADLVLLSLDSATSQYVPVVRFGEGDGTFSPATSLGSFSQQVSPSSLLAGDFNGDGYTDLLLLGADASSQAAYQVLLNDGTGHFTSVTAGNLPSSLAFYAAVIGDFNHDGKLDFAYGASTTGQPFTLFFGNGDGTFQNGVAVGIAGGSAYRASAVDLNGDGYTDLVYLNTLSGPVFQPRMLLSAGNGSYTDTQIAGLPSPSLGFVVADFNSDRIPDIFAVDSNGMGRAYLGVGNGTFNATGNPIFASDGYLSTLPFVAADFDHDGQTDVVTRLSLGGPDQMLFLWGDGKGNFTSQITVSDHSFGLQVGDINGDGIPDIFAAIDLGFGYPSVVLGRTDRNFPSAQTLLPNAWGYLSTGDVLGNGSTDLLVSGIDNNGNAGTPGTFFGFQPNGSSTSFGQAPGYSTLLVDLDGDGIPDMVGLSNTTLLIWKGDGSGVFQSPVNEIPLPYGFQPIYFRDMDGDGHMDIVVLGAIMYGKGNFQFDVLSIPFYEYMLVGDFDGDGILDILTPAGVMFEQGNRTFTAPMGPVPSLGNLPPPFPTLVVADLNGDGMDDFILGSEGPQIYLSLGRQGFVLDQELIINGYGATVSSVTVADFNGDGLPDIALGIVGGDDLLLFTNDGTGKYQITTYAIGVNAVSSITADFNRDGKPDLAMRGFTLDFEPPTVTVLLHK